MSEQLELSILTYRTYALMYVLTGDEHYYTSANIVHMMIELELYIENMINYNEEEEQFVLKLVA